MGYDLKGKMADMAGDTLKNVEDGGNKLSSENTESAQKLSNKTTHTTLEASREVRDKLVNRRRKVPETNQDAANRILLHSEGVSDTKLHDHRKKLQKKLRQQYNIKTSVKGGLKTDLRVEVGTESKLHEGAKYSAISQAASFGKRTLHMTDDMANDEKGLGIQNAWTDAANKVSDAASTVYSVSSTAKYWRQQRREKDITRLIKQEDKIAKNAIKINYQTALDRAKESDLWKNSNMYDRYLQKKAVKKKYMKNAIKEYQNAKKAKSTATVTYTTGLNVYDKIKQGAGFLWESVKALASSPLGRIAIVSTAAAALVISLIGAAGPILLMSFGGDSNNSASQPIIGTGFPSAVMDWKEWVTERCKANNDASTQS